jgi:RpiB/LacA/LacB family sugar-phosphate isomerase
MKTAKNKHVVVSADFAGFPLKEAVKKHLIKRGWTVEDLTPVLAETPMYHRAGFMLGAKIAEREYEKGLAFCGTGMGIHIAAAKCPHVHAAICESVSSAKRAATGNNCNVLAMGALFTAPHLGMAMADAFLDYSFGQGYEAWEGFDAFHVMGYEQTEHFDYEAYKANGFKLADETVPKLAPWPPGLPF